MPQRLVIACLFLLAASGAFGAGADDGTPKGHPSIAEILQGGGGCVPKDNTARILKSANPLDYAPNWSGKNYLGLAWSFVPERYVVTEIEGGIFLQGDLIATRGGTTDKNVFILFNEWKCGPSN